MSDGAASSFFLFYANAKGGRGTLVFVKRGRLAYFDLALMEPREIQVSRLPSASAFLAALTEETTRFRAPRR